ncbi:Organic solvent tolerance protein [Parvibaculum lavamentivorans DS-1]|uniref:LPS-assembly protein LptD n=2 Tax=Parvibaculum lavamentivorans TaxID=256618 RepID=A7HYG1_PARL1|nr:Organic solvent tolerance protein [Parvibaculum lavamentivorans DS-1]
MHLSEGLWMGLGKGRGILWPIAVLIAVTLAGGPARAQEPAPARQQAFPESGEVLMQADQLSYDRDARVVTASGHVELAYGERVLLADRVTYNETTGVVTADGNVSLLDPQGDVAFADHLVLRNEMRDGVIQTLRVLLSDNSRLAGHDVVRSGGNMTTLHRGVYSPCDICEKKGQTTPIWQIKAFRVIHNKEKQRIIYEDAFMEFFGVPVFYVPYFSQPDPTVKRQSGFLTPSFGSSSDLGQQVEIPYYWAIAPDKDATISPRFTSKEGTVYQGEYRQRFESGQFEMFGTATWPRNQQVGTPAENDFRGSLFGQGDFTLDENWRWGFRSELASDDTYLRRYDLSSATDLISNVNTTYIDGRNSFTADAYYFRGLLAADDTATTPWVAPLMQYEYSYPDQVAGGRIGFSANAMVLQRREGAKSRRVSSSVRWDRRETSASGFVYRLFGSLRGDVYSVEDVPNPAFPAATFDSSTITRALPTIGTEWSYPLVRSESGLRQVLEPIAQLIYSPNVGNTEEIPNEDSLSFEFDDTNLFSEDRFVGFDRWETGARANLGVRYSVYTQGGGQANVLFGQSFRVNNNDSVAASTGLQDDTSDYVGRVMVAPSDDFLLVYRFRLDDENYKIRRNELNFLGRFGPLTGDIGYAYFAPDQSLTFQAREEAYIGSVLRLDRYWRVFGQTRRDIENDRTVANRLGVGYGDECLDVSLGLYQSFYRDRDIEPENSVILQITFKTLGSAQVSGSAGSN